MEAEDFDKSTWSVVVEAVKGVDDASVVVCASKAVEDVKER